MDGIEKILRRIALDSETDCGAVLSEARQKAEDILAAHKLTEDEAYARLSEQGAIDAKARFERLRGKAEMDAKKQILAEKQYLVGLAFERAATMLRTLPQAQYVALLAIMSASASVSGAESLIFNAGDRTAVGEAVAASANEILRKQGKNAALTLSEETRIIPGGVIVSDGDVETNFALDKVIDEYRLELEPRVASVLFED